MTVSILPTFPASDAATEESFVDPEFLFRQELQWTIVDRLVVAACLGWVPDDLRHLFGPAVDPFLATAHPQVMARAPETIRGAWGRQCHTAANPRASDFPIGEMEKIAHRLREIPSLVDADLLTDVHLLHDHDLDSTGLSAEQRRAQQRITGLLKKAESTTFEAEAESLVAKAQQLRQRYRIDHLPPTDSSAEAADVVAVRIRLKAPWVRQQFLLLARVARANSCRSILSGSVGIASLVGHPDDVRHVAELFVSLNHQRDFFMRNSPGAEEAARTGHTAAYRRSFLYSYANRIGDLLTEATDDVAVTATEEKNVLPVLAFRDVAAEDAVGQLFPHTRGMSFGHEHHATGSADGVRAAERSHLGPAGVAVEY